MSVAGVAISAIILGRARLGEISERMPIADAIADAETLRGIARELGGSWRGWSRTNIARAGEGGVAVLRIRPWLGGSAPALAALWAREAAHAAFRAVPGLRG